MKNISEGVNYELMVKLPKHRNIRELIQTNCHDPLQQRSEARHPPPVHESRKHQEYPDCTSHLRGVQTVCYVNASSPERYPCEANTAFRSLASAVCHKIPSSERAIEWDQVNSQEEDEEGSSTPTPAFVPYIYPCRPGSLAMSTLRCGWQILKNTIDEQLALLPEQRCLQR